MLRPLLKFSCCRCATDICCVSKVTGERGLRLWIRNVWKGRNIEEQLL